MAATITFASHVIKFVKIAPKLTRQSSSQFQVNPSRALYRTAQTSAHVLSLGEVISSMFSRQGCDILCVLIHREKTNENLLDYQMNSQLEG